MSPVNEQLPSSIISFLFYFILFPFLVALSLFLSNLISLPPKLHSYRCLVVGYDSGTSGRMSLANHIGTSPLLPFVLLSSVTSVVLFKPLIIIRAVFACKKILLIATVPIGLICLDYSISTDTSLLSSQQPERSCNLYEDPESCTLRTLQ